MEFLLVSKSLSIFFLEQRVVGDFNCLNPPSQVTESCFVGEHSKVDIWQFSP
jgi:hypothetical protein